MVEDITQVASRGYEFGWKTTGFNLRWNDDAAFWRSQPPPGWYPLEYPPTHQYDGNSLDLAFAINCRLPEANGPMACADLGDAPDSTNSWDVPPMTAYPPGGPPGVEANFPTVYRAGSPPYGPIHWEPLSAYLGGGVTREGEADIGDDDDVINNIIPPTDLPDLDEFDDGVIFPLFLPNGVQTTFWFVVTIAEPGLPPLYVNVWFDWNRDGDWDESSEWAVPNQGVPNTPGVYVIQTLPFIPSHPLGPPPVWMRITLSSRQWYPTPGVTGDGGSGPAEGYPYGETEDYYLVHISNDYFSPGAGGWQGLTGDLDWDDDVDFTDLGIFASAWLTGPDDAGWDVRCDMYRDSFVDFLDYVILASNWLAGL